MIIGELDKFANDSAISPENYQESAGTREALIESGYDPCGRCDP